MVLKSCLVVASCLTAVTASAADLPSRRAPAIFVPPPIPVFSWTGAYFGGNVGYAFTDRDTSQTFANDRITQINQTLGTVPQSFRLHKDGITAGGQIGYNYQLPSGGFGGLGGFAGGGLVIGVEADAAFTDLGRAGSEVDAYQVTSIYHQRLGYLGTVRGRLGIAFDRLLVYGTGGFAYGETSYSHDIVAGNANNLLIWGGSRGGVQTGYAFGGGVEYALPTSSFLNILGSNAITVRAEYLYYDLGTRNIDLVGGAGAPYSFTDRVRTAGSLVRGALNYKLDFNPAPTPIVARY